MAGDSGEFGGSKVKDEARSRDAKTQGFRPLDSLKFSRLNLDRSELKIRTEKGVRAPCVLERDDEARTFRVQRIIFTTAH